MRSISIAAKAVLLATLLVVLLVIPWGPVPAVPEARAAEAQKEPPAWGELAARISAALDDTSVRDAGVGVKVVDASSGATVFEKGAADRMAIASNVKLFTTAAALELLGPQYRFKTAVYASGKMDGSAPGRMIGDLVVKGSGDPNVSGRFEPAITAIYERWAAAIKAAGITSVSGNLVIDDTVFDREYLNPSWPKDQLTHWYSAPTSGFSLNDNCIDVTISAGPKVGQPAVAGLQPAADCLTLVNKVTTVDKKGKHRFIVDRKPRTNTVVLSGTFRINASPYHGYVTVHEPTAFAGSVLLSVLRRAGIAVGGGVTLADQPIDVAGKQYRKIAEHQSALLQSIAVANGRSQNFYAEQILKTLGYEKYGEGTFENGLKAVREFLRKVGLPEGYRIEDGCGLSRENRLGADDLARLLLYMNRSPNAAAFRSTLAVPGGDGSLKGRLTDPACIERVRAKTGTLNGVSALSGYAKSADGRTFIFAIVMNRYKGGAWQIRLVQDGIVTALVNHPQK